MKTPARIQFIAAAGAVVGAAVLCFAPWVLDALSPTSPFRRCVESCLSGVEQTGRFFIRLIDPSREIIRFGDASFSYFAFMLVFFAALGSVLALCGYFGITLLMKALGLRGVTERGEE